MLSGRGLCDGPITRPEESYRLWCVVVCGLETSWMRRPWPTEGCCARKNGNCFYRRWFGQSTLFCITFSEETLLLPTNSCTASDHHKTGSFHPLTYVNLHFLDTAWRQLNTELSCTLWQIAGCDFRQLYQISNWCVHQNSLPIRHTEKLTHSNLFCFVDWLNQQRSFIAVLSIKNCFHSCNMKSRTL